MTEFERIALRIVPTRWDRGRAAMRHDIVQSLDSAVKTALAQQESSVRQREVACSQREKLLDVAYQAIERYDAWMSGEGCVTENAGLFSAMLKAVRTAKGKM